MDGARVRAGLLRALPCLLTVIPLVVLFVVLFGPRGRVTPTGDSALLELSVRDIGRHLVLLGPYSRYHWHHPGPMLFAWLAIPYRLLGSRSGALYQGAVLTATGSVAVIGWVAWRRGGWRLECATMTVVGVFLWALGPTVLRVPWNPWITVLPLLATLLLAWYGATAAPWALPVAAIGGSFLVQSHLGYGLVTLTVLGLAGLTFVVRMVRGSVPARHGLAVLGVTIAVTAVLWAPPVYQQFRDDPGNVTLVRRFFADSTSDYGVRDGMSVTLRELGSVPAQLVRHETGRLGGTRPDSWTGLVTLGALVAAAVIAWRRRVWSALVLAGFVAAAAGAATISVTNVIGPLEAYLTLWISAVGVAAWITLGVALLAAPEGPGAPAEPEVPGRRATIGWLLPVVALAVLNVWSAVLAPTPEIFGTQSVPPLAHAVLRALPPPSAGPIAVVHEGDNTWAASAGLILQLERHGYRTVVRTDEGWLFGERRAGDPSTARATVTVTDPPTARRLEAAGRRPLAHETAFMDSTVFVDR